MFTHAKSAGVAVSSLAELTEKLKAKAPPVDDEAPPVVDAPPMDAPPAPAADNMVACAKCNALYKDTLSVCPGCGHDSSAPAPETEFVPRDKPPAPAAPKFVPTEAQRQQLEEALAETFTFAAEDVMGRIVLRGTGIPPPPFGEKRAMKMGVVWAPIFAPYLNGPILLFLLALAITTRAFGSYIGELRAAKFDKPKPPQQLPPGPPPNGVNGATPSQPEGVFHSGNLPGTHYGF